MTPQSLSPITECFQEVSNNNTDRIDHPESPSSSSPLIKDPLQALVPADAYRESFEEEEQSRLTTRSWKFQRYQGQWEISPGSHIAP